MLDPHIFYTKTHFFSQLNISSGVCLRQNSCKLFSGGKKVQPQFTCMLPGGENLVPKDFPRMNCSINEEIGYRLQLCLDITPEKYLPALLEIVRGFRLGVLNRQMRVSNRSCRTYSREIPEHFVSNCFKLHGNNILNSLDI